VVFALRISGGGGGGGALEGAGGGGGQGSGTGSTGILQSRGTSDWILKHWSTGAKTGQQTFTLETGLGVERELISVSVNLQSDVTVATRMLRLLVMSPEAYPYLEAYSDGVDASKSLHFELSPVVSGNSPSTYDVVTWVTYHFPMPLVDRDRLNITILDGVAGDSWLGFITMRERKRRVPFLRNR